MMITRNEINNVCIVVVFYNPKKEQIAQFEKLANHCTVVAVDNSDKKSSTSGIKYIPLFANKGIAVAQNIGIAFACREGFEFVLLMDQDSKIESSFVKDIVIEYERLKRIYLEIGFLGPVFVDEKSKQEYKNGIKKNEECTQIDVVIASGCLIPTGTLKSVGGMDESLFIDLVDFEWGWRATNMGYKGYMTRNVRMIHSIGNEYHDWYGFVLGLSSPFRYYYQYRNTLWLCKRTYVPFMWKVKSIFRRTLDMLLVPLASNEGMKCLKFMFKGIISGISNKNTPIIKIYV